jgi:putative PIN family toxin of toxin-antitoxin system
MRVVLDGDVLVAAVRSRRGASAAWLRAVLRGEAQSLVSVPLMLHYEWVLLRPEQRATSFLTTVELAALLDAIAVIGSPVIISYLWRPMLRDPNDELVLETAVNGQADLLLTFNERDFAGTERFAFRVRRPGPAWREWLEARV